MQWIENILQNIIFRKITEQIVKILQKMLRLQIVQKNFDVIFKFIGTTS
jgi:hypothetical protein